MGSSDSGFGSNWATGSAPEGENLMFGSVWKDLGGFGSIGSFRVCDDGGGGDGEGFMWEWKVVTIDRIVRVSLER